MDTDDPKSQQPSGEPWWETTALDQMTQAQWESLCDGCAQCCLVKLEDDETGDILYTSVACALLDSGTCRCTDYSNRLERVYECEKITPETAGDFQWLPYSCAYRRLHEGRGLAWWHPLVSGSDQSVHEAGISVRGRVISQEHVDMGDLEDYIVDAEVFEGENGG